MGRFGLGLKTSSFSQCKTLTVATKKKDYRVLKRCWDLDFVNETGKWSLLNYISNELHIEKLNDLESGTIVVWEHLDVFINGIIIRVP